MVHMEYQTQEEVDEFKGFVKKYLHASQILYDLVPLISSLLDDPYLSSFSKGQTILTQYFEMAERSHTDLIKKAIAIRINEKLPYTNEMTKVKVNRVTATEFKAKNRHELPNESKTLFSQIMKSFKNPEKWKKNDRRPFKVKFINENAVDLGGPMRDAISNMCSEIMSDVLPLLKPTANNQVGVNPGIDCYQINSKSAQTHMLNKFTFFGYLLGWSLRNMGGLAIDLPIAFWRRVIKGSEGQYTYTLEDLHEMDIFRADLLSKILSDAKTLLNDEIFASQYDGFTFEAAINDAGQTEELCPGGSKIQLTRENASEFVELYLAKLTELDALQFERVSLAIEDCVGKRMLKQLTPEIASSRTCSKAEITPDAFKNAVKFKAREDSEDERNWHKWFWDIFRNDMSKHDRMLALKFMSGNSRINQGQQYAIYQKGTKDSFPEGHTCFSTMDIPLYSSRELMKERMLSAFRMCGDIDLDENYADSSFNEDDSQQNASDQEGDESASNQSVSNELDESHVPARRGGNAAYYNYIQYERQVSDVEESKNGPVELQMTNLFDQTIEEENHAEISICDSALDNFFSVKEQTDFEMVKEQCTKIKIEGSEEGKEFFIDQKGRIYDPETGKCIGEKEMDEEQKKAVDEEFKTLLEDNVVKIDVKREVNLPAAMLDQGYEVFEEQLDENLEPTSDEIEEYAKYLGMDLQNDQYLFYLAREGLMAPLKFPWVPCKDKQGVVWYYNVETNEKQKDHPVDDQYRQKYQKLKAQEETKEN